MDLDTQMQYTNLLVHHLERQELEHELMIRAVQFEARDNQAALRRRLRDRLKEEKGSNVADVDFTRCNRSVDEEIKLIDANVHSIREILENKVDFEGVRNTLKTRLVHYFARCVRIQEAADEDDDLEDLDKLKCSIRQLMNNYFSVFSALPAVRKEIMNEIVRTLSNMSISHASKTGKHKSGDEDGVNGSGGRSGDAPGDAAGSRSRRSLKSFREDESNMSRDEDERVLRRFCLDADKSSANGRNRGSDTNSESSESSVESIIVE